MASLKDISEKSGFSIRTVNRALKGDPKVKDSTKKAVLKLAKEMGYVPNLAARALKSGAGYEVIAIINTVDDMQMQKIVSLEQELRQHDLIVNIFFLHPEGSLEELKARFALSKPAGVVLLPSYDREKGFELMREFLVVLSRK